MPSILGTCSGVSAMVQGSDFVHRGEAPSVTNLATTTCYNAYSPHSIRQPGSCAEHS